MVKESSQLNRIIARYRKELTNTGISVTGIFLYGSYAHGEEHEGSDIDLIIISPDFAGLNTRERLELLGVVSARILEPIQAYGFTPEDIQQKMLEPFWSDILDHKAIPV